MTRNHDTQLCVMLTQGCLLSQQQDTHMVLQKAAEFKTNLRT